MFKSTNCYIESRGLAEENLRAGARKTWEQGPEEFENRGLAQEHLRGGVCLAIRAISKALSEMAHLILIFW